jgi:thiamine-monophosphate kinase
MEDIMREFDLIRHFFTEQPVKRKDVAIGIGDDCAVLTLPEGKSLAVTTDTLVSGVHFPVNTPARAIGHKAIAVNLSDLASMGAEPCWISLALTLPEADHEWLKEFSAGVFELCEYFNIQLIGGDTTQGPLTVSVTAHGLLPVGSGLTRSGARPGDWLYVTGDLGDAALALKHLQGNLQVCDHHLGAVQTKLDYPRPRVLAGQLLRDYASAAIDISDGLLADVGHIAKASGVGVEINLDSIPLSAALSETLPASQAKQLALTGGDDYELAFTVSAEKKVGLETAMAHANMTFTCIGQVNGSDKVSLTSEGEMISIDQAGYEHFNE